MVGDNAANFHLHTLKCLQNSYGDIFKYLLSAILSEIQSMEVENDNN